MINALIAYKNFGCKKRTAYSTFGVIRFNYELLFKKKLKQIVFYHQYYLSAAHSAAASDLPRVFILNHLVKSDLLSSCYLRHLECL